MSTDTMIDVKALQAQVKLLTADLAGVVAEPIALRDDLRREYAEAVESGRTGGTYETWLADVIDQAAVAWVLGCVFVRFCEDNGLVGTVWIGGADPRAPATSGMRARQAHLVGHPLDNDRHWLRVAFDYLKQLPATGRIFGGHNPVWRFDISADAAEALLDFFRHRAGAPSLRSPGLDTRFLGDLYQDLSAHARSAYALLQTPTFVEEFILDRAFEPALAEFGLSTTTVIDPTCGSGHFLLGAFDRLVKAWVKREPATDIRVIVERALGQVTGVDINPFAVAIARFRLMVAALGACGLSSLERAPQFKTRVAAGDSLLRWGADSSHQGELPVLGDDRPEFAYWTEDGDLLAGYLEPGQYTVVVGNPPYITVKDPSQNKKYRELYPDVAHRQYALTVPFAARFFALAKRGDHDGDGAGWVGQITANSFMKREFGVKLINDYFAGQVDLAEVIDTSGAYIPGHGTPTAILVGRNRLVSPRYSGKIRTILGIRGEPGQPGDPSKGLVWTAIVDQIDRPGSESEWVSAGDTPRERLAKHPWSLTGGGAASLLSRLGEGVLRLAAVLDSTGRTTHTGLDDAFYLTRSAVRTRGIEACVVPVILGEDVRDFGIASIGTQTLFPYDSHGNQRPIGREESSFYWVNRTALRQRIDFGQTPEERGLRWFDHSMFFAERYRTPVSIVFAFVATHNHFVLDRGGKVFNRSAPVIKLPADASEDDHLRLLGVLNSSTACFWLKQVSHDKGIRGQGGGFTSDDWEHFYEFTGTKLQEFPLPAELPLDRARRLDALASELGSLTPASVAEAGVPTREALADARQRYEHVRARMIAVQEELDWEVYALYGLTAGEPLTTVEPPELALGERAFEIVLARQVAAGETETQWFSRHGSMPITELPAHWPPAYRALIQRRIALIESNRDIGLLERPEFKRRWSAQSWDDMRAGALRTWLLDRLEAPELWGGNPTPLSVAQLADKVRHDEDFRSVLDLWVGTDHHDLVKTLAKLIADEHVPHLPADRYKPSGLAIRAQWERAWALQRREDAGETVQIAVPPKYKGADFKRTSFWTNRGKLDVPKERFVSYPKLGASGEDLYGWAGWDQLDQARALAALYRTRKTQDRWETEKLVPILAGLRELEPWLHQWFTAAQRGFPTSPADFFTGLIDTELAQHGLDRPALDTVRGVEELFASGGAADTVDK